MTVHPSYRTTSGLSEWGQEVLAKRVYAVLATVNPDGTPHTVPVGYAFDGEQFLIQSGTGSRKVLNIEANPQVRVLVQAPEHQMGESGWVAADGIARIVGGEEAQRYNRIANGRYMTEAGMAVYEEVFAPIMDVTIIVTPQRWHTWNDFNMHAPLFEHGYTEEDAAGWYLPSDY